MARLEAGMANMQIMTAESMSKYAQPDDEEDDEEEAPHPQHRHHHRAPVEEDEEGDDHEGPEDDSNGLTPDQLEALSDPKTMQKMMQPHVMQKILTMLQEVDEVEEAPTTTPEPGAPGVESKKPVQ